MSLFTELKRRNVFKVAAAYIIVSWLLLQVSDTLVPALHLPEWFHSGVAFILIIGFPIAMIFAWAFEMTPEGLKKEKEIDRAQSISGVTGQKLNNAIIGVLVLALGYFVIDKFVLDPDQAATEIAATEQVSQGQLAESGESPETDNSIAVLPFANRSRSEDDVFFSDGIHDDLLTQLAKINDLKVISRTSVMQYRDTEKTIPAIAAELGVSTILEGGIQRAGDRIRVNAQLIDVSTDEHLWAETFDREMTMENIFDIQTEITHQIVTAVKGELSETEQQAIGAALTQNLEAYEAYLHARAATGRADYSKEKYLAAQPWAEKAVDLDPEFAEAWAILAEIHVQAVWMGYDNTPKRHAAAGEALAKATTLNPASAAVKTAQAEYLYRFENDYVASLAVYREAHAIAPGDARILRQMAITMRRNGLWQEAVDAFEESILLDPANVFTAASLIDTLRRMSEWDRVETLLSDWTIKFPDSLDLKGQQVVAKILHRGDLDAARELFDLLPPWDGYVYVDAAHLLFNFERNFDEYLVFLDSPAFRGFVQYGDFTGLRKGMTYYLMGDKDQSRQYFQQQIDYSQARAPAGTFVDTFQLMSQALSWSYLGEHDKALELSQKAMEMLPREKDHIYGIMIANIHAFVLARAGKRDEALKMLADLVDTEMGVTRWELHLDPAWDFFRDDERFNELARPLNLEGSSQ